MNNKFLLCKPHLRTKALYQSQMQTLPQHIRIRRLGLAYIIGTFIMLHCKQMKESLLVLRKKINERDKHKNSREVTSSLFNLVGSNIYISTSGL